MPAVVEPASAGFLLDRLVSLDHDVDAAEGEGIRARWEFGRELLRRRVGKQLPKGLLEELHQQTGKSRRELQYRAQFAERYPTEDEVCTVVRTYASWTEIRQQALASVHYSSSSGDWATPQVLFDVLDAEFSFTLDVCATEESAKCERYYTKADDGLAQEWSGVCWMNPPYGDEIADWVAKAHASAEAGATVVCLVPARVDTHWWWDHCRYGEIRFLRGRLHFNDSAAGAPFPSAVVVFPAEPNVRWWEWQTG